MTTREQLVKPVVTKVRSNGLVEPRVASPEALEVLNKKPIPTVWGQALGLPIYDRLPGISQAYKIEAGPDSAYVYISPNFPKREGPGSIQPGRLDANFSWFVMEDGTITWSYGQVNVPKIEIDISALNGGRGLVDGQYKAGYLMQYAVPETASRSFASQTNAVLSDAYVAYAAGSDLVYHEDYKALSEDVQQAWWSNEDVIAGTYQNGSWYVLDFKEPVWPERIEFVGQPGEPATAELSVYWSDDAIIWYKETQLSPSNGSWTFQNLSTTDNKRRYWRFFWWDGRVSVGNILYTGEALYEDSRKTAPVSGALPFVDDLFEEITDVHLLVATFVVQDRKIVSITDQRQFIQRKYEPVSQWLTSFEDLSLRCYFDDIEQYASLYMAPTTADYHFYDELDTSACSGEGFITVGDGLDNSVVVFPDIVELTYTSQVNPPTKIEGGSTLYVGSTDDLLADDPLSFDIEIDGGSLTRGPGLVTPLEIIGLADPLLPGDLANFRWTNDILYAGFSLDNGIY